MSSYKQDNRDINEFNISVPWGHVAVKAWGDPTDKHVLCIHGMVDNAGSFDNLIPLLPEQFYYICMDLPSHGRSSHFPPYLPIYKLNTVISGKYVIDYFGKDKYIFIGHSLGAQIGFWFTRLYSERIEKFVAIEGAHFFTIEPQDVISYFKKTLEKNAMLQEFLKSTKRPSFEYEEALKLISEKRFFGEKLPRKAVEPILKRCLEPAEDDKFHITTDLRVTIAILPLHDANYAINMLKENEFSHPVLVIFAKRNFHMRKKFKKTYIQLLKAKNVNVVYVDGGHDVHNTNPELVAPHIQKFLLSSKSKI